MGGMIVEEDSLDSSARLLGFFRTMWKRGSGVAV